MGYYEFLLHFLSHDVAHPLATKFLYGWFWKVDILELKMEYETIKIGQTEYLGDQSHRLASIKG